MDLMLILLKTGETIVSATEQLEYEPKVHLERPYLVGGKTKVTLSSWPAHASDNHILLHSDSLLTVCDPSPTIKELYLKKIGKTLEDFAPKKTEEPVLLNEDEQELGGTYDDFQDDHGYEPLYREI